MLLHPLLPSPEKAPENDNAKSAPVKVVGLGRDGWNRMRMMRPTAPEQVSYLLVGTTPPAEETLGRDIKVVKASAMEFADTARSALDPEFSGVQVTLFLGVPSVKDDLAMLAAISAAARRKGSLVAGVTAPVFRFEDVKPGKATEIPQELDPYLDTLVQVRNHRVYDFVDRDLGMLLAMHAADRALADGLSSLLDSLTNAAGVIDWPEVQTLLSGSPTAMISSFAADGPLASLKAAQRTLDDAAMRERLRLAGTVRALVTRGPQAATDDTNLVRALIAEAAGEQAEVAMVFRSRNRTESEAHVAVIAAGVQHQTKANRERYAEVQPELEFSLI